MSQRLVYEAPRFRTSCRSGDLESVLEIFDDVGKKPARGRHWRARLRITLHRHDRPPIEREWPIVGLHTLVDRLSLVDEDWVYQHFAPHAPYKDVNGIVTLLFDPLGDWAAHHEPECYYHWNH